MKRHNDTIETEPINDTLKQTFAIRRSLWEQMYETQVREFKDEFYLKLGDQLEYLRAQDPASYIHDGHFFSIYSGNVSLRLAKQTLIDELELFHVNYLTGLINRLVTWIDWPTHGWSVYGFVRYPRRHPIEQLLQPEERLHTDLCVVESL